LARLIIWRIRLIIDNWELKIEHDEIIRVIEFISGGFLLSRYGTKVFI